MRIALVVIAETDEGNYKVPFVTKEVRDQIAAGLQRTWKCDVGVAVVTEKTTLASALRKAAQDLAKHRAAPSGEDARAEVPTIPDRIVDYEEE